MTNIEEEIAKEKKDAKDELAYPEVFGNQKVRLYELKHFIFDFGGVMIEKTFVLKNLYEIIQDDLNIPINTKDPYYKKIRRQASAGILSSREFLEKLFEKYYYPFQKKDGALPPKKVNVDYYLEIWFTLYSLFTYFSPEMEEIINRLRLAGYKVHLMSNTYDIHAKSNELKGFFNIFDNVFLSNEIGLIKPNIEKYKYVLKKLDTKPKKCVFIDNKIKNLAPAKELGFIVIKFESIEKFKEILSYIGLKELNSDFRKQIRRKYKHYKLKKKEYRKAKKEYKKIKEVYQRKKRKKNFKKKGEYLAKRALYKKIKSEYKVEKETNKEDLEKEYKIT